MVAFNKKLTVTEILNLSLEITINAMIGAHVMLCTDTFKYYSNCSII